MTTHTCLTGYLNRFDSQENEFLLTLPLYDPSDEARALPRQHYLQEKNFLVKLSMKLKIFPTWSGRMFGIVKHKHISRGGLGANDEGILRHIPSSVHLSIVVDLNVDFNFATH